MISALVGVVQFYAVFMSWAKSTKVISYDSCSFQFNLFERVTLGTEGATEVFALRSEHLI